MHPHRVHSHTPDSLSDLGPYVTRQLHEELVVRDGRLVRLRPIRTEDADLLVALVDRLSHESRYLRFFGPKPRLGRRMAEYLAGVDFVGRFAIVAAIEEDGEEHIIAVGRFDIGADGDAEGALVVRDDYQGVGLGSTLLCRLMDLARARGVRRMTGHVLPENRRMLELLRSRGISTGPVVDGTVQFAIPLDDPPSVLSVLGILARGH